MVFFVFCTSVPAAEPRTGSVSKHVCGSWAGKPSNLSINGAAGGQSALIIDNWNPSACSFTDNAVMNLARPAYVESVQLWYNWAAGESSLPYTLSGGGRVLRQNQLRRGSCDPYQSAWCEATDTIGLSLAAGSYTFTVTSRRVCQNSGSNGMGFIHVRGAFVRPGDIAVSVPATREVHTAGSDSKMLIDNWNPTACGFTNSAVMNLAQPTHVARVVLWYNWAAGESSLPYTLSSGGSVLRKGQFQRGTCDPYQAAWCEAVDAIDMNLPPGAYTFTTANQRVCQNSGSQGMGFIHVQGTIVRPGDVSISVPATQVVPTGPSESKTIIDNWNPAACGLTTSAVMNLAQPTHVERVVLWYNWAAGETSLPYTLSGGASVLRNSQFRRGTCDPYQTAWCEAVDTIDMNLAPGSYTFRTANERVCQNTGSQGMGFIRVIGRTGSGGLTTNLALGKPAQQSSVYSAVYSPDKGVDGRKDNFFHTLSEPNPWWQVDLQDNYQLSYIMLYNRTDCCSERGRTVHVLLSPNGINWETIYTNNGNTFQQLRVEAGGRRARYVRVQLAEQNYLHLQEVEVYGAK
jgi:hypothetical protein